jgi:hypothetical protein
MFKLITFLLVLFLLAGITGPVGFAQEFDIDDIIDIQTEDDVAAIREELIGFLFGKDGFPDNALPDLVTKNFYDRDFEGMKNLKQITRLTMEMEWELNSIAYLFIPVNSNNQLVIYHQGHDGEFLLGKSTIEAFLGKGFHVVGMSMPLKGMNRKPVVETEEFGKICISSHNQISYLTPSSGHPVRYFLDPAARVVNYLQQFEFDRISMVGLSGGGVDNNPVCSHRLKNRI